MKQMGKHWGILLLITDLFFTFLIWITNQKLFWHVLAAILLFTALVLAAGYRIDRRCRKKQQDAFEQFLSARDDKSESALLAVTDASWQPSVHALSRLLGEQARAVNELQIRLQSYQEFIEEWTHEIKTPLSLSALVLDNHKEEMSPYVYQRMLHVQHAASADVERILYYARLQADHVDYRFEPIALPWLADECLRDFREIAEEKQVEVRTGLEPLEVISDRKALSFLLAQLLSNAFSYTAADRGFVYVGCFADSRDSSIHLTVRDNGKGTSPEDLPFLFDKGFTGSRPKRQKATGMGLYLVKKYAEQLGIAVEIEPGSDCGKGFGIQLIFPRVYTE